MDTLSLLEKRTRILEELTNEPTSEKFQNFIDSMSQATPEEMIEIFNQLPHHKKSIPGLPKNLTFFGYWYHSPELKIYIASLVGLPYAAPPFLQEVEIFPNKKLINEILGLSPEKINEKINKTNAYQNNILSAALKPLIKNRLKITDLNQIEELSPEDRKTYDLFHLRPTQYLFKYLNISKELKDNFSTFIDSLRPLIKSYGQAAENVLEVSRMAKELNMFIKTFASTQTITTQESAMYFSSYGALFKEAKIPMDLIKEFIKSRIPDMINYENMFINDFVVVGNLDVNPERLSKYMLETYAQILEKDNIQKEKRKIEDFLKVSPHSKKINKI